MNIVIAREISVTQVPIENVFKLPCWAKVQRGGKFTSDVNGKAIIFEALRDSFDAEGDALKFILEQFGKKSPDDTGTVTSVLAEYPITCQTKPCDLPQEYVSKQYRFPISSEKNHADSQRKAKNIIAGGLDMYTGEIVVGTDVQFSDDGRMFVGVCGEDGLTQYHEIVSGNGWIGVGEYCWRW